MDEVQETQKFAARMLGRKGGLATKSKYGREHYVEMGRRGKRKSSVKIGVDKQAVV